MVHLPRSCPPNYSLFYTPHHIPTCQSVHPKPLQHRLLWTLGMHLLFERSRVWIRAIVAAVILNALCLLGLALESHYETLLSISDLQLNTYFVASEVACTFSMCKTHRKQWLYLLNSRGLCCWNSRCIAFKHVGAGVLLGLSTLGRVPLSPLVSGINSPSQAFSSIIPPPCTPVKTEFSPPPTSYA